MGGMKKHLIAGGGLLVASPVLFGGDQFAKPQALLAGGERIGVESPGYSAPCLADVDGDGRAELLVGQFAQGKIRVFDRGEGLAFENGRWLEAGGKVAEVPGVW